MTPVKSRAWSFVFLALIYVAAIAVGVVCYIYIPLEGVWLKLLVADVIATVFVFIFSLIFRNASVYDPYWSVQPMVIVTAFAVCADMSVAGILMMIAIYLWGTRLTANWAYTFRDLTHEDWRYASYRKTSHKALFPIINFCGFHLMPTLIVYACTLPAVYVLLEAPAFNAGAIVFFGVAMGGASLQGIADCTMHAFKRSGGQGFIRRGVWKYSRHPNYLGEIIMWWGIGLTMICVMPERWYLLAGALANTVMFLIVSIPLADKHQSRKDGFAEYKKQTFMLLPFKKKYKPESEEDRPA